MKPIGYALAAVGGLLVVVGAVANRYHSRRFVAHTDRLSRLSENGEPEAAAEEVREFSEDRRIDVASRLLIAEPVGTVLVAMGLVFILL